jgi:SAM-dependent methyltransferase
VSSPEDYRAASVRQWERSADAWSRRRQWLQRAGIAVSRWMLDAVRPQPGHLVLELAAGLGDTGFLAAELIRPGGRLICSDFAEPMLDAARRRAAELEVSNVEFRLLNAESLDLETAGVDAVLCRWGYMLVADPAAALQESRRVLRPGGRLALAAWDRPEANPWISLIAGRAREVAGQPEPDPQGPGMFSFAPPNRLSRLLEEAGFTEVRVEPLDFEQSYESFDHWWETQLDLGRPLADLIASQPHEQQERIRAQVRDAAAGFQVHDGGYRFPARALMASGTA